MPIMKMAKLCEPCRASRQIRLNSDETAYFEDLSLYYCLIKRVPNSTDSVTRYAEFDRDHCKGKIDVFSGLHNCLPAAKRYSDEPTERSVTLFHKSH